MGRLRRSRTHKADKHTKKQFRTRRRTLDLDQIEKQLSNPETVDKLLNQAEDEDKAGLGQFYCIECAYVSILCVLCESSVD